MNEGSRTLEKKKRRWWTWVVEGCRPLKKSFKKEQEEIGLGIFIFFLIYLMAVHSTPSKHFQPLCSLNEGGLLVDS